VGELAVLLEDGASLGVLEVKEVMQDRAFVCLL
jgi:hypothetical protein